MGNLFNMLVLVFSLGAVFTMCSLAILEINPSNTNTLYSCNDTIMKRYGSCSNTDVNAFVSNTDASIAVSNLPKVDTTTSGVSVVVQTISNVFTSIGSWISTALGLDYLQVAMGTPRLITLAFNSPLITWVVGGLFGGLIVFLFVDWMKGAFA